MKRSILLVGLAAMWLLPSAAMAHRYYTCGGKKIKWADETAHLRHSKNGFPNGGSYRTAAANAIDIANQNPSEFRFTRSWDDTKVRTVNGQNEVWFTSKDFGAPAREVTRHAGLAGCSNPRHKESDIQFWTGVDWTSSMTLTNLWEYGGDRRPFRTTYMHELGHSMGLAHENRRYNIMGEDWTHIHANDGNGRAYIGEDGSNGLVALYGTVAGGFEDLSVSQWEFKEANGEYSDHKRCGMRAADMSSLPTAWINDEPVRDVKRGQQILVEFTYENNGKSSQTVDIGFYLSLNDNVSVLDPRIGGWTANLVRNVPATVTKTVTIPANAQLGYQWLGVVIDEDDAVNEASEVNNRTYHRVRVVP